MVLVVPTVPYITLHYLQALESEELVALEIVELRLHYSTNACIVV